MLSTQHSITVEKVVESLEQMAFLTALPAEGQPTSPEQLLLLQMDFAGPAEGRLQLLAGEAMGVVLAASILGTDPSDPEAVLRGRDALKELLNISCGSVLAAWPDLAPGTCRMTIPEAQELPSERWEALLAEGGFTVLEAEGQPLAVRLLERN